MKTCVHLYLTEFFLEREVYETKVVEEVETHILPFSENRAVCEIMWKNMVEPDRLQMTI